MQPGHYLITITCQQGCGEGGLIFRAEGADYAEGFQADLRAARATADEHLARFTDHAIDTEALWPSKEQQGTAAVGDHVRQIGPARSLSISVVHPDDLLPAGKAGA